MISETFKVNHWQYLYWLIFRLLRALKSELSTHPQKLALEVGLPFRYTSETGYQPPPSMLEALTSTTINYIYLKPVVQL